MKDYSEHFLVYVLKIKSTNKVFYVGSCSVKGGVYRRHQEHINLSQRGNPQPVCKFIRNLWSQDDDFVFEPRVKCLTKELSLRIEGALIRNIGLDNLQNQQLGNRKAVDFYRWRTRPLLVHNVKTQTVKRLVGTKAVADALQVQELDVIYSLDNGTAINDFKVCVERA